MSRLPTASFQHQYPAPQADPMFHNVPLCGAAPAKLPLPDGDENHNILTLYPHLAHLSPQQLQALHLLMSGLSVAVAARRLGLARHTVSRWRNHHPAFIAELNRHQEELAAQSTVLCQRALRKSFKLINATLKKADSPEALRTALALARTATRQTLTRAAGPTNVIAVVNAMAAQDQHLVGDSYQDPYVHQDMAHRLARLNFAPVPAPASPPQSQARA
jgi:Homeodomain-like domain